MLCVLLGHALIVFALLNLRHGEQRQLPEPQEVFTSLLLFIDPEEELQDPETPAPMPSLMAPAALPDNPPPAPATASPATNPSEGTAERGFVDWPKERRLSAARVLEQEREAERIARMFAGPEGTWASLTKRQRSQLNKFKWAPGVEGLKYDDKGNAIYTLPSGCTIVNFMFFGCPLGKPKVHDDMFENMRQYFDEQRMPELKDGNGTEPEALRPTR
jgi:hypothetical protein